MTKGEKSETLCWTCRRGPRSECAWFARHKPVPGWTAERRDVLMQTSVYRRGQLVNCNKREESYRVIDCPLYLEDKREPPPPKWDGPYWDAPVCMECYSRKACMEVKGTCNRRARS